MKTKNDPMCKCNSTDPDRAAVIALIHTLLRHVWTPYMMFSLRAKLSPVIFSGNIV